MPSSSLPDPAFLSSVSHLPECTLWQSACSVRPRPSRGVGRASQCGGWLAEDCSQAPGSHRCPIQSRGGEGLGQRGVEIQTGLGDPLEGSRGVRKGEKEKEPGAF